MMHPVLREEERVVLDLARRAGKALREWYDLQEGKPLYEQ